MNDSTDKPTNDGAQAAVVRKNRTQMIVMLAVAMISLGGSYLLFYLAQGTEGWGTTNNGAWVEPPTTIADLGWQVEGDERVWWLWTVNANCDDACQATAKNLEALHILLNREADRVRRGYTDLSGAADLAWMENFPQLNQVVIGNANTIDPGIYIIDPLGNLPIFVAGGGFQHRGHVDARDNSGNNMPLCNLFVTLIQRFGIERESFNTSTGAFELNYA